MTTDCATCRLVPCLCTRVVAPIPLGLCSMCKGRGDISLVKLDGRMVLEQCRRCRGAKWFPANDSRALAPQAMACPICRGSGRGRVTAGASTEPCAHCYGLGIVRWP